MLEKKEKPKDQKCPFRNLKDCSSECMLYRKGTRINDLTNETFIVETCAINVIADNLEAMHNRTFMLQKEVGQTKNVMAFSVLANLGITPLEEAERQAKNLLMPLVEPEEEIKELPEN